MMTVDRVLSNHENKGACYQARCCEIGPSDVSFLHHWDLVHTYRRWKRQENLLEEVLNGGGNTASKKGSGAIPQAEKVPHQLIATEKRGQGYEEYQSKQKDVQSCL